MSEPLVTKQVIVVRKDLKMRRGKEIAQCSHASISFLTKKMQNNIPLTEVENTWLNDSFSKICLYVNSEEELLKVHNDALEKGLESNLITDSGRTEFHGVPTKTCLAIGPDYSVKIDEVTRSLPLY
jgi:PTH2 family peptidyl-tRNA hydrolase